MSPILVPTWVMPMKRVPPMIMPRSAPLAEGKEAVE